MWRVPARRSWVVHVGAIGINTSAMTLERVGPEMLPEIFATDTPGGCDCDSDVDLDDFVILKQDFGTTAS